MRRICFLLLDYTTTTISTATTALETKRTQSRGSNNRSIHRMPAEGTIIGRWYNGGKSSSFGPATDQTGAAKARQSVIDSTGISETEIFANEATIRMFFIYLFLLFIFYYYYYYFFNYSR
jgi:hypothetical protein